MKNIILILLVCASFKLFANPFSADSTKHRFISCLNLNFTWFEFGRTFPIKENRLNSLPHGMGEYLNNYTTGNKAILFGFELWYKNKIGIEILPFNYFDLGSNNSTFENYILEKYPNYHIKNGWNRGYHLFGLGYRVNYKFQFKHFQITPKFQIGVNRYQAADDYRSFKEKGSNHILEYSIEKTSLMKNIIDYHLLIDISRTIYFPAHLEIGIVAEFITTPTLYQYTITKNPYGSVPVTHQFSAKQYHPAWAVSLVARAMIFK